MTEIYLGIIGFPIKHSVSPAMHSAAMKHLGINGVYLAFEVRPELLEDAVKGAKALKFTGLNVTIPFKEEIMRFVEPDKKAAKIGAINTIDLRSMKGYNTDVDGALMTLEKNDVEIEGKIALVVGAGGAGKAVAYGLLDRGATVILTNRTESRGREAVEKLRKYGECIFYPYDRIYELKGKIDIIVNATPLGMAGFETKLPVPSALLSDVVVFDTVYNPPTTPLIAEAVKRGCKAINGLDMLVFQGAKSFEIWTGMQAPVDVMKRAAKSALGVDN
jgi:shikimate dehydrogenase